MTQSVGHRFVFVGWPPSKFESTAARLILVSVGGPTIMILDNRWLADSVGNQSMAGRRFSSRWPADELTVDGPLTLLSVAS